MSLFRSRRRKLLFGVAAFGLLLAAFAGFLLAPEWGRDETVRMHAPTILTNQFNQIYASFSVTNTGDNGITIATIATQLKTNGQWSLFTPRYNLIIALQPGQSTNISGWITHDDQKWRIELVWYGQPSRLQKQRNRLKVRAGKVIPSLKPDSQAWQNYISHTNYSPEFTH